MESTASRSAARLQPLRAARELRDTLGWVVLLLTVSGGSLIIVGLGGLDSIAGGAQVAGGVLAILLAFGLHRFREWARWGTQAMAVILLALGLGRLLVGRQPADPVGWIFFGLSLAAMAFLAIYLPSSAATRAFQTARELRTSRLARERPRGADPSGPGARSSPP